MTGDCGDERRLVEPVHEGLAACHARRRPRDIAEERDLSESIPAAERREGDPLPLDADRARRDNVEPVAGSPSRRTTTPSAVWTDERPRASASSVVESRGEERHATEQADLDDRHGRVAVDRKQVSPRCDRASSSSSPTPRIAAWTPPQATSATTRSEPTARPAISSPSSSPKCARVCRPRHALHQSARRHVEDDAPGTGKREEEQRRSLCRTRREDNAAR